VARDSVADFDPDHADGRWESSGRTSAMYPLRQGAKTPKQDQRFQWTTPKPYSYKEAESAEANSMGFSQFTPLV